MGYFAFLKLPREVQKKLVGQIGEDERQMVTMIVPLIVALLLAIPMTYGAIQCVEHQVSRWWVLPGLLGCAAVAFAASTALIGFTLWFRHIRHMELPR